MFFLLFIFYSQFVSFFLFFYPYSLFSFLPFISFLLILFFPPPASLPCLVLPPLAVALPRTATYASRRMRPPAPLGDPLPHAPAVGAEYGPDTNQ
jgi:hypothetical protein